jgi:hypothetical protein
MLVVREPEPPEQFTVGTPEECDAAQPLPIQLMGMNPVKIPIDVPGFSAWIVLGVLAGTPGLGSWATAHEAVSSAMIDKRRFIASSVRIVGAELVYKSRCALPRLRQFSSGPERIVMG